MVAAAVRVVREWMHVSYEEPEGAVETYGFVGSQARINLEGVLLRPDRTCVDTVLLMMHPSSTLQLLPLPESLAQRGFPVLCMGSRYARNDTALIYEKILLDLGACVRFAKEELGFGRVVLLGWSGGGSLALFYQSQAEKPTITCTTAGDPLSLMDASLIRADAVILEAAHRSRARCLLDWIDPSVIDESDPDRRDPQFDLYTSARKSEAPFPADWLAAYQGAQLQRIRKITAKVRETLDDLRRKGGAEQERGFVTHRTMAAPRFLDASIDPNDRTPGHCYLGVPEVVNSGAVGLARFSMLRSWLSQWSIEDSRADGEACAGGITVPLLVVEHSADDAVPQPDMKLLYDAAASVDKEFHRISGANHYFKGQPEQLRAAGDLLSHWLQRRGS